MIVQYLQGIFTGHINLCAMKSPFTETLCKAPNRQAPANRLVWDKGGKSRTKESNNEQHSFRNTDQKLLCGHWEDDSSPIYSQ